MGAKKILIRVWSALLIVFNLGVFGLGIVALVFLHIIPQIGITLVVLGVLGILVAISGCIGAGYRKKDKEADQGKTAFLLIVFFAVMCFFHVVFVIFGVILIFLAKSLSLLELLPVGQFLNFMDTLPESWLTNVVTKIKNLVLGVGIVLVVISAFHLATVIITAFRIGKTLFAKFFVTIFSIIDVGLGLALAILVLVMTFSKTSAFYGQFTSSITVPLIVSGFVLALVGGAGIFTACVGVRYKVFTVIFNIGNIILLAGFFGLLVVSIIIFTKAAPTAKSFCDDGICDVWVDNANNNKCPAEYAEGDPCYTVENMVKAFEGLFKALASILIFICVYFVFFVAIVVFSTGVICCKKDKNKKKEGEELYNVDSTNDGEGGADSSSQPQVNLSKLVNW